MKKQLSTITLALGLFVAVSSSAQQQKIPCVTYEAMEQHFKEDPSARTRFENSQKELAEQAKLSGSESARPAAFEYTVPVVFHILHQGGPENISDAACIAALQHVNNDYARMSQDTNLIWPPFKSKYIPSDIKFMLAKRDPNGNCINGIIHHFDAKTNWNQGTAASSSVYWPYTWDPTRYLNIYIVANIIPQGTVTGGGIIVGYTYIPGTWPTYNAHDAIVYRYNFLNTGFPNPDARSLSHEIGHWLSLPHTFGNTNNPGVVCGDDGITDTPPTKGSFATCPAASTNTNFTCSSPNPSNSNNYFQNVENIMDYASCPKNFTQGQTTNMRNLLASNTSGRNNLWSASNLSFTGINNTTPCAPVSEFLSNNLAYTVCAGGSITFKDVSYNGTITAWQWAADNGAVVSAPTATQTSIMFPNVGQSVVSLTVSNAQGTSTRFRTVQVMDATPAITGPNFESFEAGLPPNWEVGDVENDNKTWASNNLTASDQNLCYYIEGSVMPPNTTDYLQMPMMDVKNNSGNIFQFAYAYRKNSSTHNDVFKIQGSRDCGGTWEDIVAFSASQLASGSGETSSDPFLPMAQGPEWKTYVISNHPKWLNYLNSSSVLIRFTFTEGSNGFGNNFYLDAINFYNATGVNELTQKMGFGLYPNPSDNEAFVRFNLHDGAKVGITVTDLVGREVIRMADTNYSAGEQVISINKDGKLNPGVYFVNMTVNGAVMTAKLSIQ